MITASKNCMTRILATLCFSFKSADFGPFLWNYIHIEGLHRLIGKNSMNFDMEYTFIFVNIFCRRKLNSDFLSLELTLPPFIRCF